MTKQTFLAIMFVIACSHPTRFGSPKKGQILNIDDLPVEVQAEFAVGAFVSQENDRWLKLNSFMYGNGDRLIGLGYFLIIGALLSMLRDGHAGRLFWLNLSVGWSGLVLIFATMFRSETKTGFSALKKAMTVLIIFSVCATPMLVGIWISIT